MRLLIKRKVPTKLLLKMQNKKLNLKQNIKNRKKNKQRLKEMSMYHLLRKILKSQMMNSFQHLLSLYFLLMVIRMMILMMVAMGLVVVVQSLLEVVAVMMQKKNTEDLLLLVLMLARKNIIVEWVNLKLQTNMDFTVMMMALGCLQLTTVFIVWHFSVWLIKSELLSIWPKTWKTISLRPQWFSSFNFCSQCSFYIQHLIMEITLTGNNQVSTKWP